MALSLNEGIEKALGKIRLLDATNGNRQTRLLTLRSLRHAGVSKGGGEGKEPGIDGYSSFETGLRPSSG
jgi:hypothetical protein